MDDGAGHGPRVVSVRTLDRRRLVHVAGVAIGVAGLVFIGVRIHRDWHEITDTLHDARVPWLLVAVACGLGAMAAIGANWLALVDQGGARASRRRGFAWFFTGQLGKYVPGGIWPVVGQAELAGRGGVERRRAYLATVSSMFFQLLAALSVAAIAGIVSPNHRRLLALALAAAVTAVLAIVLVPAFRAVLVRITAKVTRGRVEVPGGRLVARFTARHVPVWVLFALTNVAVHRALGGSGSLGLTTDIVFASALAWAVGFVVVGVPGGIGVRESVFVALMSHRLGGALALSIAVTGRLVTIAVDLLGAVVAGTIARASRAPTVRSVQSPLDAGRIEADHPDPVFQRGGDVAADGRGSPA